MEIPEIFQLLAAHFLDVASEGGAGVEVLKVLVGNVCPEKVGERELQFKRKEEFKLGFGDGL